MNSSILRSMVCGGESSGPLSTSSFVIKDNISLKGSPTSWGISPPHLPIAGETAQIVQLLLTKGATLKGATNLDPFAIGASGVNPFYGTMSHADKSIPVLGSSGGAAIEVRRGAVDFGVVTDIAGSARLPAISAGLYGLKLKATDVSNRGVLRFHSSIETLGLLASTFSTLNLVTSELLTPSTERSSLSARWLNPEDESVAANLMGESFSTAQQEDAEVFSECLTLHPQLVANSVQKIFAKIDPSVSQEASALLMLKTSDEATLSRQLAELRAKAKKTVEPDTIFLSLFERARINSKAIDGLKLQIANVLDWPAIVVPLNESYCFHAMANTSTDALLHWTNELLAVS